MNSKNPEPERLRRGKVFHKEVQEEWHATAKGDVETELTVKKDGVGKGRMDVFVSDGSSEVRAIVEIKNSDWDRMTPSAVKRNVRRQARQVWKYIELHSSEDGICPGIIFPKRPHDPRRMELIESLFEEETIAVVWQDETIEECRARLEAADEGPAAST